MKILTGLIASGAGGTFHTAQDDLAAGIGLSAVIAVDAEILSIIKDAFMIPVRETVSLNLFGDSGGVLAQEPRDNLKRSTFVQFVFNIDTVIECEMFLVARDMFTHKVPPSTAVRRRHNYNIFVCKSKYQLCRGKFYSPLKEWNLKFHFTSHKEGRGRG